MKEEEFEKIWQQNRDNVLANDDEYQRIRKSYSTSSFADYAIMIGAFFLAHKILSIYIASAILEYILDTVVLLIVWLLWRLVKSFFTSSKTLEDAEKEAKEHYRSTIRQ
jgi:hypothetical protein